MNKESNDLFKALSDTSENVYVFQMDLRTGISEWSDNALSYFGLPEDYQIDTLNIWVPRIHPDDRKGYLEDINAVLEGRKSKHKYQYRVKNRYGDYVWMECVGNVTYDEKGRRKIFAGLMTRLDNQVKYDPITKLLSAHHFYTQDEMLEPAMCIMTGMDDFRRAILSYGYEAGNEMLILLASIIDEESYKKRIYRMYGDELLVVFPYGTAEDAQAFFECIKNKFREEIIKRGFASSISFSGAAVEWKPGECTKETMVKRLEHCMDQAKSENKGELVFFSGEIVKRHRRFHEISKEMEWSIAHGFEGFELYYQPIKNSRTSKIEAVEALLRFHSQKKGMISPVEFIPILEENRDIIPVGIWVMEEAVRQCKEWQEHNYNIHVNFNVSYLQLYDHGFVDALISMVKKYNVTPDMITVELTESMKVMEPDSLALMFKELLTYGFGVALDDFGMEYSSLTLIRDIPVTTVKIDHSFVRNIKGDDSREDKINVAIISCISDLCKKLEVDTVVEGVENIKLDKMLSNMDVTYLQGYCYSVPIPAKEVEKLFDK